MKLHYTPLRFVLFYVILLSYSTVLAQKQRQEKIDSLFSVLKSAKTDTAKVNTLNGLGYEFRNINPDTAVYFANLALELAINLNYKMGEADSYLNIGSAITNLRKYEEALKNLNDAISLYNQLFPQFIGTEKTTDKSKILKQKTRVYNNIGNIYEDLGNYPEALKNHFVALKIREEIGDKNGIASSYSNIGDINNLQGNYPEALKNYLVSLKIREEIGDKKDLSGSYLNIGTIFHKQGNYSEALKNYFSALKIKEEIGDKVGIANTHNNIGGVYRDQGNYPEAWKNHLASLKIREEIGDKKGIATSYTNIGLLYWNQGNYPEALKNQFAALKIREEIGDKKGIAVSCNSIGLIYWNQVNYSEALKYYFVALKIEEEIGDKNGIAVSYNNIGIIYSNLGNYPEALKNYFGALKIQEETGDNNGLAISYINIGNLFTKQNKTSDASQYLNKGLSLAKEISCIDQIKYSYDGLAKLDSVQGNFKQALENYKMFIIYRDSLVNEENTKKTVRLQMQYEFDKQEDSLKAEQEKKDVLAKAEVEELNRENEIQKLRVKDQQSQLLQASLLTEKGEIEIQILNQSKEIQYLELNKKSTELTQQTLFSESKNREVKLLNKENELKQKEISKQKILRNSIAGGAIIIIFSSLFSFFLYKRKRDAEHQKKEMALSLQVSETEMKALRSQMNPHFVFNALQSIQTFLISHKSEEANIYLLKFSKLMRAVLENSQHREISLEKDLLALELYMQLESIRLPHPFTYKFHVDESVDLEEMTVPPLILQPFVENAIWHGLQYKKEAGHIDIYLIKKDNALFATVEDNGVGRDMSKKVEHPMLNKKESLGMKLTEERLKIINELKKIRAQFKITDLLTNDNIPAGTKVELSLPLGA